MTAGIVLLAMFLQMQDILDVALILHLSHDAHWVCIESNQLINSFVVHIYASSGFIIVSC